MGQKVHPTGFRLGYIKKADSIWYVSKKDYANKLLEDKKIRKYLEVRMLKASVSKINIERAGKKITITMHTARPGIVIGKGGAEVDKIREELKDITDKEVVINISEIKRPELDAKLVAAQIAQQLKARMSYKRVMKQAITATMRVGAQGIKLLVAGRLDGAEIARSEQYKEGAIPLHTLRSDIDYAIVEAHTIYGVIGVKVWISKGAVYGKRSDFIEKKSLSNQKRR